MNEVPFSALRARRLTAPQAAALVAGTADEFAARRARGEQITVPPDDAIVLARDGAVRFVRALHADGPVDGSAQLASLLRRLLNLDADGPPKEAIPGALMVLVARALGQIDLPPPGLPAFREALGRVAPDARVLRAQVAASILGAAQRSSANADLTRPALAFVAGVSVAVLAGLVFERQPFSRAQPVVVTQGNAITQPLQPAQVTTPAPRSASRSTIHLVLGDVGGSEPFSPSFAADGRTLYFHTGRANGRLMRANMAADGTVTAVSTVLSDAASNFHVVPSADGSRIAFDSDRSGVRGVYVARADGTDVRRVSGDGVAAVPTWSPDGGQLAFVKADARDGRVWNVWIADLDTGRLRQVSHHRLGQAWGASWFPGGGRIAYSREEELVILDLSTGQSTAIRSPRAGHLVRTPAVSPDGTRVVFQVYGDGVWMLDLARGRISRVLTDRTAEEFRWSPDGRRIAYHARNGRHWGVWTLGATS